MKYWIIIASLIILGACNSNKIFSEYKSIDESLWYRTDIKEFDIDVTENGTHNIELALRYIEGCPHKTLPIKIDYISPSGEKFCLKHEFIILNENEEYQGSIAGSICDIEDLLEDKIDFNENGTYKFIITQELDSDPAMLIMEIGLIIEKSTNK